MLVKYGTYLIYECQKCGKKIEVPLSEVEEYELEKTAGDCTHNWFCKNEELLK